MMRDAIALIGADEPLVKRLKEVIDCSACLSFNFHIDIRAGHCALQSHAPAVT